MGKATIKLLAVTQESYIMVDKAETGDQFEQERLEQCCRSRLHLCQSTLDMDGNTSIVGYHSPKTGRMWVEGIWHLYKAHAAQQPRNPLLVPKVSMIIKVGSLGEKSQSFNETMMYSIHIHFKQTV
jgi:hypothetical protein